jgi:flagellar M-ring protein FliF
MPERRLFERDREPPRASIVLKLRGDLEGGQVRAIRHLVASAVEGLKPERVSIVDERGRLLADGAQAEAAGSSLVADEKQTAIERRLRSQVEEIVAGIVGPGRTRVQVAAELDLNRVESRSETFDPESRVVRSTQTRAENQLSGNGEGAVSVGNELPGASAQGGAPNRDSSNKNEEVVNYEISRTTRTEVLEGGRVKRLSVAVVVDGLYARGGNGEATYQPRPQEELDRIAALVRTAIGFDRNRGDQIEVVNLRFADAPTVPEIKEESLVSTLINPGKEDILRLLELGVIAILTLVVILVVVRPMLRNAFGTSAHGSGGGFGIPGLGVPGLGTLGKLGGESGEAGAMASLPQNNSTAQMMEIAKINGQMRSDSVEQLGNMVKGNPQETVAVLRNWIHDR